MIASTTGPTIFTAAILVAGLCHAQGSLLFPTEISGGDDASSFDVATGVDTRWSFRAISPVVVSSPIVRLCDVVEPIDINQAGWQRLGRAAIGLVPISGETMTIRRDRLNRIILSAEATPHGIDWHGPTEIRVEYRAGGEQPNVTPVNYQPIAPPAPAPELLSRIDAERIVHWIELAIKRFYPDVDQGFKIDVPLDQSDLAKLRFLNGVSELAAIEPIKEGRCRFKVVARSAQGEIEADVHINLTAHPKRVVPMRSLARGHRIEADDLQMKSFPVDEIEPNSVTEIDSIVGQEVRSPLQRGRAIGFEDVGSPILIHRGDLVEIRVIGGGVSVTTNAKALGDGAHADLIEIETLNPRKRLVAQVAGHGSVEIVTRAPVVR